MQLKKRERDEKSQEPVLCEYSFCMFSKFSPVLNHKMSVRNDQCRIYKQQDERRTQSSEETGSGTFYCGGGRMLAGERGTPVSAWVCMELSRFAVGTVCQPRCVIPMPGLTWPEGCPASEPSRRLLSSMALGSCHRAWLHRGHV